MRALRPWLDAPWRQFQQQLTEDRLGHALLVQGARGTGKLELAEAMAARLACTVNQEFACGECRSCKLFQTGAHPDFSRLEPPEGKHVIRVEQARELIASLALTTSFSDRKVALIAPAEAMNASAANALLKNLEEPPGHAFLILVTHDASRLPVTIRSRCQDIVVRLPEHEAAVAWLRGQGVAVEAAKSALAAAGGSPGRALEYVQADLVETHRKLVRGLDAVLANPALLGKLSSLAGDVEAETLWTWLSHCSADAFRGESGGSRPEWLRAGRDLPRRRLASLQQEADRNRRLTKTTVRQDLLIREWLVEWAGLASQP